MLVTVIIATVCRKELLKKALEGALSQRTNFSVEIIVVDNSKEGSQEWIRDVASGGFQRGVLHSVRYVHEGTIGLASARNRGLAEARGEFVVFLDDDEQPVTENWLQTLVGVLEATGADAVFGPVRAEFQSQPERFLAYLTRIYSRQLERPNQAQVTDRVESLGTGNSCFRRKAVFGEGATWFDVRYNNSGGEDVDLLVRLKRAGRRFVWAADAAVTENVSPDRFEKDDLAKRRFRQGQQRTMLHVASQPRRYDAVVIWMIVGLGQAAIHVVAAAVYFVLGDKEATDLHMIKYHGGLGKLLWQKKYRVPHYGIAE